MGNMVMEDVPCNLCGGERREKILEGRDRLLKRDGLYSIVRCRDCGLVYLNPRPARDSLGLLYGPEYQFRKLKKSDYESIDWNNAHPPVEEKTKEGLRIYWNYPGPAATLMEKLTNIPCYLKAKRSDFGCLDYIPGGKALDVGCGRAKFITGLKALGWDAYGTDFSDDIAKYAADAYGVKMKYGDFHEMELPEDYFNVITMWQFLEHSYDPKGCLRKAHSHVKKGGLLLVAVPNFGSLESKFFKSDWLHLDVPRHLYHFTPVTLERLFNEAGFKVRRRIFKNPPSWTRNSIECRRESRGKDPAVTPLERKLARLAGNVISLTNSGTVMIFIGEKY